MDELLSHWHLTSNHVTPMNGGLINETYKIDIEHESNPQSFILQRINQEVFHRPENLMLNYQQIHNHLQSKDFVFASPNWHLCDDGSRMQNYDGGYWRLGTFFRDTESFITATDADMAWKVGHAFGQYDKCLFDLTTDALKDTIENFHNLHTYINKLSTTLTSAPSPRLQTAKKLIESIDTYLYLSKLPFPKNRIIHNDAKVSNLLFRHEEVYAVIDWDTTMAGHISWEYADLFRTTVVNVPEDHPRLDDLSIQADMMEGLHSGYKSAIWDKLSSSESGSLYHGALYLIFEQAVRFLEDYLAGDRYYKCDYDDHNYIRARNQFHLLALMVKDQKVIINSIQRS